MNVSNILEVRSFGRTKEPKKL